MPKYSVLLEGKNFPLKLKSETMLYGFYTTRRVKAENEEQAELLAVAKIKSDSELTSLIDSAFNSEPRIYCEGIRKIGWWSRLKLTGYTFYPMDSE